MARSIFLSMLKRVFAVVLLGLTARAEIILQEKVAPLPFMHQGPFVRTGDGANWGMDARGARWCGIGIAIR